MPDRKKSQAAGDAPEKKKDDKPKGKGKEEPPPEPEEIKKSPSQIAREEAEYKALMRKLRFKRRWPEITKVKIHTRPWRPPPPPQKLPRVFVELPEIATRKWVPPYMRRRRRRPKLQRIPPEQMTQPLYEGAKLKKIWHNFIQVEKNKMMLQGNIGCNSKRYSSTACGSQTACIAVMCRALLTEKTPAELVRSDVDELIEAGDRYYKQCMVAMKCYKGKPQLQLIQLLSSFFFHDNKYTIKMFEVERGLLAKHPDNVDKDLDLMGLMEKRVGSTYMMILSTGDKHFLIWGHPPPPDAGSACRTVCYIFDPHMLNDLGQPHKLFGAGAFLRYAGINSFVMDFIANYGDLEAAKMGNPKPSVVLTSIDVVQKERLLREPTYELDLKALKIHCQSEWESMNKNALIEKKIKEGKYPQCSLSAVSLATSRATRKKVRDFYQKASVKDPMPVPPVPPEKPPAIPTMEQILSFRGEDFFLNCPKADAHAYGRDDMLPRPKSEVVLHSAVDVADQFYRSQYHQLGDGTWILRGTRHFASYRYQTFKTFTGIACCLGALATLRRLRARAWNEDTLDETLDLGYNIYRESLVERGGPIRRLVLGELKENFRVRDQEFSHKERGIAVWGKLISSSPNVLDLCRGLESFFKESDSGILQIPGDIEVAIWHEGGKYYVYHPWPADEFGYKVGLQDGGKACVLYFTKIGHLCEHFLDSVKDLKKKAFTIADVMVRERGDIPDAVNKLKAVAPNRWVLRGRFHEADARFPEEHRGKQATPTSIAAIAMAHIVDPCDWTTNDVDETLVRGDILYENTMEHLYKLGISLDTPKTEEEAGEEEEKGPTGTLAAADVLTKFKLSDYDCIETDVLDSAYSGELNPEKGSGILSLKDSIRQMFKEHSFAVLTARGGSTAIWKQGGSYYFFDPHGCDESGYPSDEPRAAACLVRVKGSVDDLVKVVMGNLAPGVDNSFNLSPVTVTTSRLVPELGAPETKLESKAFQWISKGTAAVLMGPRGENTAIGKAAEKAGIGEWDMAGRTLALPAAAAFAAAAGAVPPPYMHQEHMYYCIDAGTEYYLNHVKKTGRKEINPEDLTEKFEMGANTFSIQLGEPIRLPLRLPDAPVGEGEEEEGGDKELEGELEEEEKQEPMKQIKDALFKMWYDTTKPTSISLLVGDYHQMGVWMSAGGKVVAFDPAPTIGKGMLTSQRIKKGDEIRLQRIKDEMSGEGVEEQEEEEAGGEGEEKPEPEPEFVPPESCPALMVFATPGEFIDKLMLQGPLDKKQCLAPYKLYPVTVINELTSLLKEKKKPSAAKGEEEGEGEEDGEELIEPLEDAAVGKYFTRLGRAAATLRGRVAQDEPYFQDQVNRDNQDAANAAMGIVVDHIEPYIYWKPALIDAILKYGDRLHSMSLPNASAPPKIKPVELQKTFHVTSFNVKLDIEGDVVRGDIKAGETGPVLNLARGIQLFFESHKYGILCCKEYCVGIWVGADGRALCLWEPHAAGPTGAAQPAGAATLALLATPRHLAHVFTTTMDRLATPGSNQYSISSVKVFWELAPVPVPVTPQGTVPEEGYEWKVLTAYVETARGRTILRGSRPPDLLKFRREARLQSSCGAVAGACMSVARRPALWTRHTVDEVMALSCHLFMSSVRALGYEFRPAEDVLLPLQVVKRFILGVNYVKYDLQQIFTGKLEQKNPAALTVRSALERFFESHTHGILWSAPYAVAVWKTAGAPAYYMMEPHACGPTGLRIDAQDDGAACVLTFTSAKLMAFAYLLNVPVPERLKHDFILYAMSISIAPIKKLGPVEPPLVKAPPGVKLVPATSKVGVDGTKRMASEKDRKHPPGDATCEDAERAALNKDKEDGKLENRRHISGWLVLKDRSQFMSAQHSMRCKKFVYGSRGYQALACSVMAVAMSRVEDVCRWCGATLDQILESGDQLYQDSYLHFNTGSKILGPEQILRKFYTPGNCVCRVVIYRPRQRGTVDSDLLDQVTEFFREEKMGVFVAGRGDFAVALFRTPRGFYMFDPDDRDRYGRAVAPPCRGRARACFSYYPNIKQLVEVLGPNIPPVVKESAEKEEKRNVNPSEATIKTDNMKSETSVKTDAENKEEKEVRFEEPAPFAIYGMEVTSLRKINKYER